MILGCFRTRVKINWPQYVNTNSDLVCTASHEISKIETNWLTSLFRAPRDSRHRWGCIGCVLRIIITDKWVYIHSLSYFEYTGVSRLDAVSVYTFAGSAPPGARRWLEGQHCGVSGVLPRLPRAPRRAALAWGATLWCFWGPDQAAGTQRSHGKNRHDVTQHLVKKQLGASMVCISARCTPSRLFDS